MEKRGPDAAGGGALVEAKKPRTNGAAAAGGTLAVSSGPARTSELLAPIMLLTGHGGAVLTTKFSPDGRHILSGSHDKTLLLWEVFGQCKNTMTLKGHANAVLEAHWLKDGEGAVSCSADKTLALWDVATGGRTRQFKGHSAFVNSCCPARDAPILASGSDDSCARIWDMRVRTTQRTLKHPFAVTSAVLSASAHSLYTGCLDGVVRIFDLRRPDVEQTKLEGHQDIVTGMALSPDGGHLLSNSMDNTVRCWDVRPFCDGDRCTKVYLGAQHNYEKTLIKCARRHADAPAPPPRPPLLIPRARAALRAGVLGRRTASASARARPTPSSTCGTHRAAGSSTSSLAPLARSTRSISTRASRSSRAARTISRSTLARSRGYDRPARGVRGCEGAWVGCV